MRIKILVLAVLFSGIFTAVSAQKYITKTGKIEIFSETPVFVIDGVNTYIQDNEKGTLQLYTLDVSGNRVISNANAGTINYTTGKVNLKQINVQSCYADDIVLVSQFVGFCLIAGVVAK